MPGVQKHRCTNISALQQPLKNFTCISWRNFVIKVMMVTTISEWHTVRLLHASLEKLLLLGINDGAPFRDGFLIRKVKGRSKATELPLQNWGLKPTLPPSKCTSALQHILAQSKARLKTFLPQTYSFVSISSFREENHNQFSIPKGNLVLFLGTAFFLSPASHH